MILAYAMAFFTHTVVDGLDGKGSLDADARKGRLGLGQFALETLAIVLRGICARSRPDRFCHLRVKSDDSRLGGSTREGRRAWSPRATCPSGRKVASFVFDSPS